MREIKKDKFWRDRGSVHIVMDIVCVNCNRSVIVYQKDGRGNLYRTYLNRIMAPESLARLQDNIFSVKQLRPLKCECGNMIGIPMHHWEGRLAFRLIHGAYQKRRHKGEANDNSN